MSMNGLIVMRLIAFAELRESRFVLPSSASPARRDERR